jgi:hypothetical protein
MHDNHKARSSRTCVTQLSSHTEIREFDISPIGEQHIGSLCRCDETVHDITQVTHLDIAMDLRCKRLPSVTNTQRSNSADLVLAMQVLQSVQHFPQDDYNILFIQRPRLPNPRQPLQCTSLDLSHPPSSDRAPNRHPKTPSRSTTWSPSNRSHSIE